MTAEPELLPLPRTPAPGVMTESPPPNTHTQTCTHRRMLTDTYYTRTHVCTCSRASCLYLCTHALTHTLGGQGPSPASAPPTPIP